MTPTTGTAGPATPRPMRADARRNYERLLTEAGLAFAEHGADASLDDIAKRAGVGNATLYRHFPNRETLLEAVYRDEISQLRDLAYTSAPAEDAGAQEAVDALTGWLRASMSRSGAHNGLKGLFVLVLRDEGAELGSWCRETITSAAGFLLTRAQRTGAIRQDLDALTLLRLVNAITIASEQSGGPDQAEQMMSLVVDGLRTR
ncbi:TetR/AcrR family transcriptional regulator [Streptomyces sp. NBC_01198]|uniref:TetR/AcrR family transcriptional regulator n=1 Tax=Streptomyces sp. NBC_01198 TaxID=2903769 RepID=UPI002E117BA3|nr:TetR/AcrR family transcriptional regulator [Streptomyces sp. NBC_01198]